MSKSPRRKAKSNVYRPMNKEFLQEIVEPEVQAPEVQPVHQDWHSDIHDEQNPNWDDLTERERDEIIQKERAKNDRPIA